MGKLVKGVIVFGTKNCLGNMLFILETILKMYVYDEDKEGREISIVIKYEWSLQKKENIIKYKSKKIIKCDYR